MKQKKVNRAKVDTLMLVLKTDLKKNSRLVLGQHKQMGGAKAFFAFLQRKKKKGTYLS